MILHCIGMLSKRLDSLRKMTRIQDYNVIEAMQHLDGVLKTLEMIVSQPLPALPADRSTELDKHLRKLREQEWDALYKDCRLTPVNQLVEKYEEFIDTLERMAKVLDFYSSISVATYVYSYSVCYMQVKIA